MPGRIAQFGSAGQVGLSSGYTSQPSRKSASSATVSSMRPSRARSQGRAKRPVHKRFMKMHNPVPSKYSTLALRASRPRKR
jgi:hypothetical protein